MRIALVSDTHFQRGDVLTLDNWRAVTRWLQAERPDLVVHLGDITANGAHDPAELDHGRDLLKAAGDIIRLPGNHDLGDHAPAGGIGPPGSR